MFQESSQRVMEIPEEEETVVDHFLHWLYTKRLPSLDPLSEPALIIFAKLIGLAEKYTVVSFKNRLVEAIHEFARAQEGYQLPLNFVKIVFDTNPAGSKVRMLATDWLVWNRDREWYDSDECGEWLVNIFDLSEDLMRAYGRKSSWMECNIPNGPIALQELGFYSEPECLKL